MTDQDKSGTAVDAGSSEPSSRPSPDREGGFTTKVVRALVVALILVLSWQTSPQAKTYTVDQAHTSVTFSVRHLFTNIQGRFDRFEGTIVFDPEKPKETTVTGSIDTASINTNVAQRDKHLRTSDFFHVEKFPKITFKSTAVSAVDPKTRTARIEGDLTIRDVTRPVALEASYLGTGKDPWGNERTGFSASVTINRRDFGLTWNKVLETGGVLVGDEVEIQLQVEGIAQEQSEQELNE